MSCVTEVGFALVGSQGGGTGRAQPAWQSPPRPAHTPTHTCHLVYPQSSAKELGWEGTCGQLFRLLPQGPPRQVSLSHPGPGGWRCAAVPCQAGGGRGGWDV